MQNKLGKSQLKYQPEHVKLLFIAEAPPEDITRYFYYEDVKTNDALFLNIVRVIYPEFQEVDHIRKNKRALLSQLKDGGYYLIDALPEPVTLKLSSSQRKKLISQNKEILIKEVKKLLVKNPRMKVILVKSTVYDALNGDFLQNEIPVLNNDIKLPFPSQGHCTDFRTRLTRLLNN